MNFNRTARAAAGPGSVLRRCLWLLAVLLGSASAQAEPGYQLGRGFDVGDFNFAGYTNVVGELPQRDRERLSVDDLSLFVTGHVNRFVNPFLEAELTGWAPFQGGGPRPSQETPRLVLERLYDDAYLSDAFTLRAGKMLAPVGEWNQIHAAPLVPTTIRPLVTLRSFSQYVSGASLLFAEPVDDLPEIQGYWQPGGELAPRPDGMVWRRFHDFQGLHVNWPMGLTDKIGVSFQHSQVAGSNAEQLLYGANAKYSFGPLSLESEATVTTISGGEPALRRTTEWGGYVLGSYALGEGWSVYSWYEQFSDRMGSGTIRDLLFGVSYRPLPPLVFKLERLKNIGADGGNPTGYFASVAVMF